MRGGPASAQDATAVIGPGFHIEVERRPGIAAVLAVSECERVLAGALRAAGAPAGATVTLTLSDDTELASLNAAHMGASGPTDVLAFPLLPPSAFPLHAGQDPRLRGAQGVEEPRFALPPGQEVHLGDIVVSVERAVTQAREGIGGQTGDIRWAAQDELRLLITHGALHLCGWDHAEPDEEAAMRALESRLLAAVGQEAEAQGYRTKGP